MPEIRPLTRKDLASFLPDQRSIIAFEKLFDLISEGVIDENTITADTANAKASEALGHISNILNDIQSLYLNSGDASSKAVEALDLIASIIESIQLSQLAPPIKENNNLYTDYIDLNETSNSIEKERRMAWNSDDGTLSIGLYGNAILKTGQASLCYAQNDDGSNLSLGTPVMIKSANGTSAKLTFEKAVADGSNISDDMLGVMMQDIDDTEYGYIVTQGVVSGFRTDGVPYSESWANGDYLYFDPSTSGSWTNIQPSAPNIKTPVAVVLDASSSSDGSIYVMMARNERLDHLNNVDISSVADGDLLQYNSSNTRWENVAGATGSFTTTDGKTVTVTNGIVTSIV